MRLEIKNCRVGLRTETNRILEIDSVFIEEFFYTLGLWRIADKIVHGSSVKQLKLHSIAMKVDAQSSLLLLDEPTSELDARAVKIVADYL